jgi:hypothetical protein
VIFEDQGFAGITGIETYRRGFVVTYPVAKEERLRIRSRADSGEAISVALVFYDPRGSLVATADPGHAVSAASISANERFRAWHSHADSRAAIPVAIVPFDKRSGALANPDSGANVLETMIPLDQRRRVPATDPTPQVFGTTVSCDCRAGVVGDADPASHIPENYVVGNDRFIIFTGNSDSSLTVVPDNASRHPGRHTNYGDSRLRIFETDRTMRIRQVFAPLGMVLRIERLIKSAIGTGDRKSIHRRTLRKGNHR